MGQGSGGRGGEEQRRLGGGLAPAGLNGAAGGGSPLGPSGFGGGLPTFAIGPDLPTGPNQESDFQFYSLKFTLLLGNPLGAAAEASKIISFLPNLITEPHIRNRVCIQEAKHPDRHL